MAWEISPFLHTFSYPHNPIPYFRILGMYCLCIFQVCYFLTILFCGQNIFDSFRWYNQIQFQERKCILGFSLVFKSNYKKCKMLPTFQNSCNICLGALWNLHSKNIANTGFRKHKSFIASILRLLSQIWAPQKGSDTVNFLHVHFHEDTKGKRRSFT